MHYTVGTYPWTIGAVLALLVVILAILGLLSVIPDSPQVVFGFFIALALSRLI